jgi:hypothetical protein
MDLSASIRSQNSKFNCETSTGHINKLKRSLERCNSQLSNAPKNIKNGSESLGTSTDLSENRPYGYVTDPDRTDTDGTDTVLSGISVAILK